MNYDGMPRDNISWNETAGKCEIMNAEFGIIITFAI